MNPESRSAKNVSLPENLSAKEFWKQIKDAEKEENLPEPAPAKQEAKPEPKVENLPKVVSSMGKFDWSILFTWIFICLAIFGFFPLAAGANPKLMPYAQPLIAQCTSDSV